MALGPGKYDELATLCRTTVNAQGAIVIIIDGDRGHGFSVQIHDVELLLRLPAMLRTVADEIERSADDVQ